MYVIGIDGGGTKTEAVALNLQGKQIAHFIGDATNPFSTTFAQTKKNLAVILDYFMTHSILQNCTALCLGIAGIDRADEREKIVSYVTQYAQMHNVTFKVFVKNDAEIALMAAFESESGIVVISGTGSIVYGITPEGEHLRVGGWGPILGDKGSGYDIGLSTLQAVFQSRDGLLPQTTLTQMIIEQYKLSMIEDLRTYVYEPSIKKQDIANFARLCIQAAEQGDQIAQHIIQRSASDLAQLTLSLRQQNDSFTTSPIATSGSIFKHSTQFKTAFLKRLSEHTSHSNVSFSDIIPAVGAAQSALFLIR